MNVCFITEILVSPKYNVKNGIKDIVWIVDLEKGTSFTCISVSKV